MIHTAEYKLKDGSNLGMQQSVKFLQVFADLLRQIQPARVLEIGTASGAASRYIRDQLDEIELSESMMKSFDVQEQEWYDSLRSDNLEIIIENMFDYSYLNLERPELVDSFIQSSGTTLVLCDGGHKIGEFNNLAYLLKPGDYIMAHDYAPSKEYSKTHMEGVIWDHCEIWDAEISNTIQELNLVPYQFDTIIQAAWCCFQRP